MFAVIEDAYDNIRMCDILLLGIQLAKFVIEHEKDMLHVKLRTTIIIHTRSAMTIQHNITLIHLILQSRHCCSTKLRSSTITGQHS